MKLRRIHSSDLNIMFEWRNDPRIYKWCRQYAPIQWESHVKWFESLVDRKDVDMFIIEDVPSQRVGVLGLTDIDNVNRRAEFSIYINPIDQGKGYGERALNELLKYSFNDRNLYSVWGETFANNPATKLFLKVGMREDGVRRNFYFREGKYINARLFSITSAEWGNTLISSPNYQG